MMIYDVAMVDDHGSYWAVNGVTKNSFENVDNENRYLKLSGVSAKLIQDAIKEGHEVRIAKPLLAKEVLPNEVKVIKNKEDDIVSLRNSYIKRVRMLINPEMASTSGLSFYAFICLNNELADKGYFITDSNREAKLHAIRETGDEKLISQLENYLSYRDEIARVSDLHKSFEVFRRNVMDETSPDNIQKLTDSFMENFYSRF